MNNNDLGWLDAPIRPSSEADPEEEKLVTKLRAALADWSSRAYVPGAQWTAKNERHRAVMCEKLSSLISQWERKGYLSNLQVELAKKLASTGG